MKKLFFGIMGFAVVVTTIFLIATTYNYEITFVLPNDVVEKTTTKHNDTVDLLEVETVNYEVLGWYYDKELTKEFNHKTKVSQNQTLYAKVQYFTTHRVFFDAYNGLNKEDEQTVTVREGDLVNTVYEPSKEGYVFKGWYYDDSFDKSFSQSKDKISDDLVLFDKWEHTSYQVKFLDENNLEIANVSIFHSGSLENNQIPKMPVKVGYTFMGWDQDLDSITKNITARQVYQKNTYLLSIDNEGLKSQDVKFDDALDFDNLTKTGYDFLGWFYLDDNNTEHKAPTKMPAADLLVYPKWQVNKYTVTFLDEAGSLLATQEVEYNMSARTPMPPIKIGYNFVG